MKNYHIVQKNLSAKIIKRSSELLKIPKTFSRKKISRDQWRIFKIKKKIPPNEVSASKRINFHPDGRALDGPNPPSFPVSYSPPSQEAAPVAFERCTARKSSRGWLEKAASFQVFPLGAYSTRPSHPRASLVTRKNKRDQLAASRLKSENWEGRGEGGRRLAGRIFCAFRKRHALLSLFFFFPEERDRLFPRAREFYEASHPGSRFLTGIKFYKDLKLDYTRRDLITRDFFDKIFQRNFERNKLSRTSWIMKFPFCKYIGEK